MDIGLNSNFDVELDDRNDLPLLTGRDAFEQRLAFRSTAYFHQILGSVDKSNLISLLRMYARRIAKDADDVAGVIQIEVQFSDDEPNTAEVTAIYETGDEFAFSITE
jgi:hypothetical protein